MGRWASVLALVTGLSGVSVAAAEPRLTGSATGSVDLYVAAALSGAFDDGQSVRAILSGGQVGLYDDDADNEEEEEDEGQEDGLLPGGQAEQRAQGLGDKAESKEEDHENGSGE